MPKEFEEGDLFMFQIRGGAARGHIAIVDPNTGIVTGICEEFVFMVKETLHVKQIPDSSISISQTDPRMLRLNPDKVGV